MPYLKGGEVGASRMTPATFRFQVYNHTSPPPYHPNLATLPALHGSSNELKELFFQFIAFQPPFFWYCYFTIIDLSVTTT